MKLYSASSSSDWLNNESLSSDSRSRKSSSDRFFSEKRKFRNENFVYLKVNY